MGVNIFFIQNKKIIIAIKLRKFVLILVFSILLYINLVISKKTKL